MNSEVPTESDSDKTPHPMDPDPVDSTWRERLFHEDLEYPLCYTAVRPGEASAASAWEGTAHLDEFRSVVESVVEHRGEEGLLVLLADPDRVAAARVYAAVCMARLLAERGLNVLIAQTHADEQAFLRIGEFEEVEGFVDLVLYGVSPSVTCRPTRLPRIDVLSLGSFRPEPGNVYPEDELRRAFSQLRASYDVILMMGPARISTNEYNPLLAHGDAVVMVTGVQRPKELEAFRTHLEASKLHVWGAVVFTSATETVDFTVEGALEEKHFSRPIVTNASPPLVIHEGNSSPLFRRFTWAIAVIFLGFVGWWVWMQFLSGDRGPEGEDQVPVVAAADPVSEAASGDGAILEGSGADDPELSTTPAEDAGTPDEGANPVALGTTTGETGAAETDPIPLETVADPGATAEVAQDEPFEVPTGPAAVEAADPTPTPDDPDEALRQLLKLAPGGGYGLYVWSFPDSQEAEGALQPLRSDGYQPAVVPADLEGKGRWYRVVVGKFGSRQEALAARDLLTARSDVEWAGLIYVN